MLTASPQQTILADRRSYQAELYSRSFRHFVEAAWRVTNPATPFIRGWHIDAIADHLDAVSRGQIRRLLINMPPRHGKSTLVSVMWPSWEWTRAPWMRYLYASYAQVLSIRDSVACRRLIESPWYQDLWGGVFQLSEDQNQKTRFDNDRSGYRIATSVGGLATGEGGDRLVVDDPHNALEAASDVERENAIDWWKHSMSTRGNNPQTSARVIVMQRLHERDLSGVVLAEGQEEGGYVHLALPAEYDPNLFVDLGASGAYHPAPNPLKWEDPRTKYGELLWSPPYGEAEMRLLKRDLGPTQAAGQLGQRPSPAEGGMLLRSWWRRYTLDQVARLKFEELLISWDMAFKGTTTSDFVVGQLWGRVGTNCYLLDQARGRWDMKDTLKEFIAFCQKHPYALRKLVEDKANGPAVIAVLGNDIPGIQAVNPLGGKEARVFAIQPMIEAGNVWIPEDGIVPWTSLFVEEAANFPNTTYDDQVDAMSQALAFWLVQWMALGKPREVGKKPALIDGVKLKGLL